MKSTFKFRSIKHKFKFFNLFCRSVSAENTSAPIVSPLSSSSSPVFMVKLPSPSPSSVVKNYVKLIEHNNTPSTDASVAIRYVL